MKKMVRRRLEPISRKVKNLVLDRVTHGIDDELFKNGLKGILSGRGSNPQNVGASLCRVMNKLEYVPECKAHFNRICDLAGEVNLERSSDINGWLNRF